MSKISEDLKVTKEKLKAVENKLDAVLDLVHKTFTGDSNAARELSTFVGVAPPILCNDDEAGAKLMNGKGPEEKLQHRLEFLDRVMTDHEKMVSNKKPPVPSTANGRQGQATIRRGRVTSTPTRNRVRSADRCQIRSNHSLYQNPYTWNLNNNSNEHSMFAPPSADGVLMSRPLREPGGGNHRNYDNRRNVRRSFAVPTVPASNSSSKDSTPRLRTDDVLFHYGTHQRPSSRPTHRPSTGVHRKEQSQTPTSVITGPLRNVARSSRPISSQLTYQHRRDPKRHQDQIQPQQQKQTGRLYHQLPLQTLQSDNGNEDLLQAMERRFELSTIELQRRLGISRDGMVGL